MSMGTTCTLGGERRGGDHKPVGAGDRLRRLGRPRKHTSGAPRSRGAVRIFYTSFLTPEARLHKDAGLALAVGIAERAAGQFDASIAALQSAIELKKNWPAAYYQLGLTYIAQSKYSEAQTAIEKAQSLDPDAAVVQQTLGETLLLGGKPRQARPGHYGVQDVGAP